MENWELDFEWLRIQNIVKEHLQTEKTPDLNAVLVLIGIQELGTWKTKWTKEEKQDLMHVAVSRLLSQEGYYEFVGRDDDGWPHYKQLRKISTSGIENQEMLLKKEAIKYFDELARENNW
ncbi:MAG: hypothetical protein JNK41_12180 [Saprospiraceae bacterium]|nr:hypothetical protein [Saprospiraceae bacterium]